jgi:hypothetical protein
VAWPTRSVRKGGHTVGTDLIDAQSQFVGSPNRIVPRIFFPDSMILVRIVLRRRPLVSWMRAGQLTMEMYILGLMGMLVRSSDLQH